MGVELPPRCSRRFRVERVLAAGAFGAVCEATQLALDRRVALKLLHSAKLADGEARTRFLDEARITASLSSPHIVGVIDHDAEQGMPWIAYELLPGGSLADALADGPMPWPAACAVAAQVASALEVAHARGILHRDIKPRNVMDAGNGVWKVADFGLARWDSRSTVLTDTGAVMGTPHYMAPEMVRGEVAVAQTDLYALGVLLFELIAGEPPFLGSTVLEVLGAHLEAPVPSLRARTAGVPHELDALIRRLMAKEIARRPPSARAVRDELERLRAGASPASRGAAAKRPRSRPDRPRGRPLLAAVAVAGVMWAFGRSRSEAPRPIPPPAAPRSSPSMARMTERDVHARLAEIMDLTEQYRARARRDVDLVSRGTVVNDAEVAPVLERALIASTALVRAMREEAIRGPVWANALHPVLDELLFVSAWMPARGGVAFRTSKLLAELRALDADAYRSFAALALAARHASLSDFSTSKAAGELLRAVAVLEAGTPKAWQRSLEGIRVRLHAALAGATLMDRSAPELVAGGDRGLELAWRRVFEIGADVRAHPAQESLAAGVAQELMRIHALQVRAGARTSTNPSVPGDLRQLAAEHLREVVRRLLGYRFADPALAANRDQLLAEAGRAMRRSGDRLTLPGGTVFPEPGN